MIGRNRATAARSRRARIVALALGAIAATAGALAPAAEARVKLGVYGDVARFDRLTGQNTTSRLYFPNWDQGQTWPGRDLSYFDRFDDEPLISLTMMKDGQEHLTPRQVARGQGDAHLVGIARAAVISGKKWYVRPFGEMNGHWNSYSAFNANGTRRDEAHSQKWLKQAFRRAYIIMHGGSAATMSSKLRALDLPGVKASVPANPSPNMTVVWNPQGYGSPNVSGNTAHAYWPGRRYVDMVANDLYSRTGRVTWGANQKLYEAHPKKPYAIGEWGLRGIDDPATVRRMAEFARTHSRVRLLVWFNGNPGTEWNLQTKPESLRAYKRYIVPFGR